MTMATDFECDCCQESSRYMPPFCDMTLSAWASRGREGNPPQQWSELPELVRVVMGGIVQPSVSGRQREVWHELRLCGMCGPRMFTPEGQQAIIDSLRSQDRIYTDHVARQDAQKAAEHAVGITRMTPPSSPT